MTSLEKNKKENLMTSIHTSIHGIRIHHMEETETATTSKHVKHGKAHLRFGPQSKISDDAETQAP